jgi:hypothetical protein
MTTARIAAWADTWRQIPRACDLAKCKWRGPFPTSEHKPEPALARAQMDGSATHA